MAYSDSSYQNHSLEKVRKNLNLPSFSKEMFQLLAETFQALGDPSRVQIVWALSHGELSVGTLAELLSISQPAVSQHLRTLRNLRLVKIRKVGTTVFYQLDDHHINHLLKEGIDHKRLAQVHAPIGLDLGAETPDEIALSIAAEIVMLRKKASGASLKTQHQLLEPVEV